MNERQNIKKAVEEAREILKNPKIKTKHLMELSPSAWEVEGNLKPGEQMLHLPKLQMYAAFAIPKQKVSA